MPEDVWRLDATDQAELVRGGKISALELTNAAIDRIERLNPQVNAVVHKLYDTARERARQPLAESAPFAGVPLLVKDASLQIEGTPYSIGTKVLRDMGYRSDHTTELAQRLLNAGFIVLGKTNCPEMSSGVTTEPAAFGPTCNPWDLSRTAGGSSGGSAAAVAAGMTSIAHGGDATGSLRYPASLCGVVTLKPSRGLVPSCTPTGLPEDGPPIWAEFMLARSVRDLAGVLDAVAEPHATSYEESVGRGDEAKQLRVGILTSNVMLPSMAVQEECVAAVELAGKVLQSLGHKVERTHPPSFDRYFERTGGAIMQSGIVYRHKHFRWLCDVAGREITADEIDPSQIITEEMRARVSDEQLSAARELLARESAMLSEWWNDWDLLVTPVLIQPAWPLGRGGQFGDVGAFPSPFSFSGQPAMSVPLHWTPEGLPVGVQIAAAPNRDDLLLQVAAQLERAQPWANRWPEISTAAGS
jgi:amidase